jgi:ribulose-phosphate 3-epimerase
MVKISISFLSMRDNLLANIREFNNTNIDYIHLDIMDNIFVSNSSYNYNEIKTIVGCTNKPLDIHLMVNNLDKYINDYNMYNTEYITIHYEAMLDTNVISKIKSYGIKCGISIKPSTQVEQIFDLLDKIDLVLIMSVEPGEGGQEFIDSSYEKIYKLKQEIKRRNLNVKISIDGGINEKNIKTCIDKGIDIVVLGSYMLKIQNIKEEVDKLKDIV